MNANGIDDQLWPEQFNMVNVVLTKDYIFVQIWKELAVSHWETMISCGPRFFFGHVCFDRNRRISVRSLKWNIFFIGNNFPRRIMAQVDQYIDTVIYV